MRDVIKSYVDDPDKLLESGETIANTALTLTTLLFEGPVATAAGIILLVEMAGVMWNSPELIHYSDNKEEVAYESGKIIGGILLVAAIFKSAKDAINALKSDIHVQYMVTSAKLQMQGIISKSDTLAALTGKISNILKCVEGSFNAEAMAYLEEYLTAEKGSRFLEVVRKLEKELGDKKTQLDTAKAKRIVECLDDGMSVDDVVAEMKVWCESGRNPVKTIIIRRINHYFDKTFLNNVKAIKEKLPSWAKEKANFGYSEVDIEGVTKTSYCAHSSIQTELPSVKEIDISVKPESSPFKALKVDSSNIVDGESAWLRDVDVEYKILSDIQSRLGNNYNVSGSIKLCTELAPCPSCQSVIEQFSEMYPNIEIEVLYNIK